MTSLQGAEFISAVDDEDPFRKLQTPAFVSNQTLAFDYYKSKCFVIFYMLATNTSV